MPIIRAAIKHLLKSEKLRSANRFVKDHLKEAMKDMLKLAREKKMDEFKKRMPKVTSMIDKAAKKNLLHKNNASRKKSRLSRLLAAK